MLNVNTIATSTVNNVPEVNKEIEAIHRYLGDDYTLEYLNKSWVITRNFNNGFGVIIKNFHWSLVIGGIESVSIYVWSKNPNNIIEKLDGVQLGGIARNVEYFLTESDRINSIIYNSRKPEIGDSYTTVSTELADGEKRIFENASGTSKVMVTKTTDKYGLDKYSVTTTGNVEIVANTTPFHEGSTESAASLVAKLNELENENNLDTSKLSEKDNRIMYTFGDYEYSQVVVFTDRVNDKYIVSTSGSVEVTSTD